MEGNEERERQRESQKERRGYEQHNMRTSNQDGSTLVTGFMTSSKPLDKTEQKDLFHNWTHGKYLKSENYVSVSVFQADR